MTARALFLKQDWRELWSDIDAVDGEITPELYARMANLAHRSEADIEEMAVAVLAAERDTEALGEYIDSLRARAAASTKQADTLRKLIGECLDVIGISKVKGLRVTISRTPARQRVDVTNADAADLAGFLVPQPPKLDVAGIGKALKAGNTYTGARLVDGAPGVQICTSRSGAPQSTES